MCDYSLHNVKSRPAKVRDKLTTRDFHTGTRGFSAPEDGRRMSSGTRLPAKEPAWAVHYHLLEGEFRSRKNANRHVGIFRRRESASAGIEIAGSEFVANLGRT